MGINVVWKDERGESLGEVDDPRFLLSRFAARKASPVSGSLCLRFLDPAGDACFNQRQLPFLVQELRTARDGVTDPALVAHLDEVLRLVERANELHTYVWFVGD
jgi:hypothetical protein